MAFGSRSWRALSAAAGLVLLLDGCSRDAEQKTAPDAPPTPAAPAPALPTPPPPLGRAELLAAVEAAASAAAGGAAYPQAAADLADRRFQVRLPFGCRGPSGDGGRLGYAFDADKRVLRLSVRPEIWTEAAWARELVGSQDTEAIEGFWISRPWLKTEACPAIGPPRATAPAEPRPKGAKDSDDAPSPAPPQPAASPETVGLAQAFAKGGSRLQRRGERPYEVTRKLEVGELTGVGGFRLVLEGRIAGGPDGRPIRCSSEHPDRRPVCLVRVEMGRVAIEDAAGQMLAEWRS